MRKKIIIFTIFASVIFLLLPTINAYKTNIIKNRNTNISLEIKENEIFDDLNLIYRLRVLLAKILKLPARIISIIGLTLAIFITFPLIITKFFTLLTQYSNGEEVDFQDFIESLGSILSFYYRFFIPILVVKLVINSYGETSFIEAWDILHGKFIDDLV